MNWRLNSDVANAGSMAYYAGVQAAMDAVVAADGNARQVNPDGVVALGADHTHMSTFPNIILCGQLLAAQCQ